MPTLHMVDYNVAGIYLYKLPVIELCIAGEAHNFIVDSGAMETVLNTRFMSRFLTTEQHRTRLERNMNGVGGTCPSFAAKIPCTFIGVSIHHVTFVSNVSVFDSFPVPISGLIGQDVLQQFNSVEFDFKAKVIRFKL